MKEITLKATCFTCAKLGVEHGARSNSVPSGDLHFCKRTDEIKPQSVCRFWRPAQKWLDNQLWKAAQANRPTPQGEGEEEE